MQRSFSIVEDDDDDILESTWKDEKEQKLSFNDNSEIESEENSTSPKRAVKPLLEKKLSFQLPEEEDDMKILEQDLNIKLPSAIKPDKEIKKIIHPATDSEDSENDEPKKIAGEYDPKLYENLEVDEEIKELFQYITKYLSRYIPQQLGLDNKFKPFIPEFLPAVGDIDAFLKVIPPETTVTGENFDEKSLKLGLTVLDEPAANQSDPALLHLQLRATSVHPVKRNEGNVVVKKVENLEKGVKVIDKWIKDITDLHKTKSSPVVRYSEAMPDLDDLMQQWPEDMENKLKENGFPKPNDMTLSEYIDTVCNLFQIPVGKKKIQSLHLLFCLYAAIKQTQLYQASAASNEKTSGYHGLKKEADQLVLE